MFEPRNNSTSLTKSLLCKHYRDEPGLRLVNKIEIFFHDITIFILVNIVVFNQVLTATNYKIELLCLKVFKQVSFKPDKAASPFVPTSYQLSYRLENQTWSIPTLCLSPFHVVDLFL